MTIQDVKIEYQSRLNNIYSIKEISSIFTICLEHIGISRINAQVNMHKELTVIELQQLNNNLSRLEKKEPIQYILEQADFYGHVFRVNSNVLIPRQETEMLVHTIIQNHKNCNGTVLELCTGSGCIPISLWHEMSMAKFVAVDISQGAIETATQNAKEHKAEVEFKHFDVLATSKWNELPECDILVSNPPYVRLKEQELMHANVLDYEPHLALFVENDNPLIFYDAIAKIGQKVLAKNGYVYCEINEALGLETKALFEKHNYVDCEIICDLHDKQRIIKAKKI